MPDEDVRKFLRYYWTGLVDYALSLASLDDHEMEAVNLCGRRRMTIEQAAEMASPPVSVNTMQTRWAKARKRLSKAWDGIGWIMLLVGTVED